MAAFALPFSGAVVIFSFKEPSSCNPTISLRELFGITFNVSVSVPSFRNFSESDGGISAPATKYQRRWLP